MTISITAAESWSLITDEIPYLAVAEKKVMGGSSHDKSASIT